MTQIDPKVLAYVSEVADLLNKELAARDVGYGEYHVSRVTFGFEGEVDQDVAIIPGEHGSLVVEVGNPPR